MNILIIGCRLQGVEAVYLAKKAGFFTTAVDRDENSCAAGLADRFVCCDFFDSEIMTKLFRENDAVLPAVENIEVCERLLQYGELTNTPVIFDKRAYAVSSSKSRSDKLFGTLELLVPQKYPDCGFPVIIKPDDLSGSKMVFKAENENDLEAVLEKYDGHTPIIGEYLSGKSYSLEVLRINGKTVFPMITEVVVDNNYDCKEIIAPAEISENETAQMFEIAEKLDSALHCEGIFDIEVISHGGVLKILEIDARLPSQTPVSVYHASGFNMVKWLAEMKVFGSSNEKKNKRKFCCYCQIKSSPRGVEILGEHIMSDCGKLRIISGFFGADEAVSNYRGTGDFRAIMIFTADSISEAENKRNRSLKLISEKFNIPIISD